MEFAVKIKETLERTVIIEAEDKYQALEIVEDKANDEINLDAKDFSGREVLISDEFPDGVVPDDADVSHYMHVTNIVNTKISYLYRDASNYKLCHARQHPAAGRSAPEKAAGLQRRAPHRAPQPRLPRCLRRAGPFGLCGDARLAARRRRHLESAGSAELPRDGLPVPQPPQHLFVGRAGQRQRRRRELL